MARVAPFSFIVSVCRLLQLANVRFQVACVLCNSLHLVITGNRLSIHLVRVLTSSITSVISRVTVDVITGVDSCSLCIMMKGWLSFVHNLRRGIALHI